MALVNSRFDFAQRPFTIVDSAQSHFLVKFIPNQLFCYSCSPQIERSRDLQVERSRDLQVERSRDLQVERSRDLQVERSRDLQVERSRDLQVERSRNLLLDKLLRTPTIMV